MPDLRPACDLGFVLLAEDGSEHSFRAREREIEAWVRKTWIQHTVIAVFVAESARGIAPTNEFSAPSSLWLFEASYKGLRRAILPHLSHSTTISRLLDTTPPRRSFGNVVALRRIKE